MMTLIAYNVRIHTVMALSLDSHASKDTEYLELLKCPVVIENGIIIPDMPIVGKASTSYLITSFCSNLTYI